MKLATKVLPAEKWIEQVLEVMTHLEGMTEFPIGERFRSTLRRACEEAIVSAEDRIEFDYEHRNSGERWSATDIKLLDDTLKKRQPCVSWKDEKILLEELTSKLGRPGKIIKKKAIELGHGRKVDYWINSKDA